MFNKCPDCNVDMQVHVIKVLAAKDKYYQECPICYFTADLAVAS